MKAAIFFAGYEQTEAQKAKSSHQCTVIEEFRDFEITAHQFKGALGMLGFDLQKGGISVGVGTETRSQGSLL